MDTHRCTKINTQVHIDSRTHRHGHRHTDRCRGMHTHRETQTDRCMHTETHRHTDTKSNDLR